MLEGHLKGHVATMEHFLRDLRSLDASDFERLAKAQDATRRHRRAEAYRTGREKLTRRDEGGAAGIVIREAVLEAMRVTGYEGDHLSAVAAAWWTGLARTFRDELTDAEFAALSAVWSSMVDQGERRAPTERVVHAG
jgi:hypothetical protein